jgi:hypothetical protein
VVRRWFQQWDGSAASLQHKKVAGRPRILTRSEVQRHIAAPIRRKNRSSRQVRYTDLVESIREKTGKQVSSRTVQRIGMEQLGGRKKKGKKRTAKESQYIHTHESERERLCAELWADELTACDRVFLVSAEMCEQIAKVRRKLQRIGTNHILFLDETYKREGDVENYTIVLPGEPPYIESSCTSKYAPRYDMIACCTGREVLPPIIYSPKERDGGVTAAMLLDYIRNLLAQAAGALDRYPLYLITDRSTIHNEGKMMETFHDWGCQELVEIIMMPPAAAKRLSPLDNCLFNLWRQRVLTEGALTRSSIRRRMSDAWNSITAADLQTQYRNCGLMRHQDVYFDCPSSAAHRHGR